MKNAMRELDYKKIISEIQKWIKEYAISTKVDGVVVGISGGIDSAVTTSLCVNALGKKNVIGLGLPCSSIPQDLNHAKKVAEILGIKFIVLELTSVYNEFLKVSTALFESNKIATANLKPRLRMMAIYYVGQSLGKFLVAGTSNRTEIAIGYFTKYGDGGVDIMPLGDLYKTQVWELAKFLKIPKEIISKPPTAGLWAGQFDEEELKLSYNKLDLILAGLERKIDHDEIARIANVKKSDVERIRQMRIKSEHKRRAALIPKVGLRTPGYDWRSPILKD